MRSKTAEEIEEIFIEGLEKAFNDKIDDIAVVECTNEPYPMVGIEFQAYKYFNLRINYDRGSFGCCIINGELGIGLDSTEEWFDKADLNKFFQDIIEEIEIRIPDKFLIKKGWK